MSYPQPSRVLVTDFDGTITDHDFYELIYPTCVSSDTPNYWEQYFAGQMTHFDAMRGFFSHITCDEARLHEIARAMKPDPDLAQAVARLRQTGWDIVVASAGCLWYIKYLLDQAGVSLIVHANPGFFEPGRGLVLELPADSPFLSTADGIDKTAVVQDALARYDIVAFAGNGPPDLSPAKCVPANLRFARGWLAETLTKEGLGFRPYQRWAEVANFLAHHSDKGEL
ncbi:MAG TPA: 2,3-diketo-5-methylthio-1-phosphopentane phosphatase [Acidobacteriota bacterium]|nr:2,3-diketo-5-methylthio-1-phosphopentane phosphatase [Acidobacteriota bacterium]